MGGARRGPDDGTSHRPRRIDRLSTSSEWFDGEGVDGRPNLVWTKRAAPQETLGRFPGPAGSLRGPADGVRLMGRPLASASPAQPMGNVQMDGVFPLPLDGLWSLLHAHLDEGRIRDIHPWMRSGRTIREEDWVEYQAHRFPRQKVAERLVEIGRRPTQTTWRYTIEPPSRYSYEVDFENGSRMWFDNTYGAAAAGTLVTTIGEVSIKRVPSLLAVRIAKRSLNRSDAEDLAYARRMRL
jgi:hypothetical protein